MAQNSDDGLMHHQRTGHQRRLRPLSLVAALLAVLGLLTMHTLVVPTAADAATSPELGHTAHEHSHPDHLESHAHPTVPPDIQASPGSGPGSTGGPCATCPSCDHETAAVCALAPAKTGSSHLLPSANDLAPAPHQLTSWSITGSSPPLAFPAPPSLTALSISRT